MPIMPPKVPRTPSNSQLSTSRLDGALGIKHLKQGDFFFNGVLAHTLLSRYPTAPGAHSKTLAAAQGKPAALSSTVKHLGALLFGFNDGRSHGEGTRGAGEARDDGAAAFNDGESPYCLAHQLCRASFAGFGSGRALLAGGVMGMRGDMGGGARRPEGDTW